jgi:hypothetical protein
VSNESHFALWCGGGILRRHSLQMQRRRGLKLPISVGAEHPQKFHSKRFVLAAAACARVCVLVCVRPQLSSEMRRSAVPRRRQGARRGTEGHVAAAAARRPRDSRGCSGSGRRALPRIFTCICTCKLSIGGARTGARALSPHRPCRSMQPPSPRHPRPTNRLHPAQSAPSFEFMQRFACDCVCGG